MNMRREAGQRETECEVAAGRLLRVLTDVLERALVNVEAAGDVAIEEERLGERDLIVLGAATRLQRTVRLSPRPRKFDVWKTAGRRTLRTATRRRRMSAGCGSAPRASA